MRPVVFIEAPQLRTLDAKSKMVEQINAAMPETYGGIANTSEILILHNEYPLENTGWPFASKKAPTFRRPADNSARFLRHSF